MFLTLGIQHLGILSHEDLGTCTQDNVLDLLIITEFSSTVR